MLNLVTLISYLQHWRIVLFIVVCSVCFWQYDRIKVLKQEHIMYIKNQTEANLKAQTEVQQKIINAERAYSEKLKQISNDADVANFRANSLSKQLIRANELSKSARREAIEEYNKALSNVFTSCIAEYSKMAKVADANGADAERKAL